MDPYDLENLILNEIEHPDSLIFGVAIFRLPTDGEGDGPTKLHFLGDFVRIHSALYDWREGHVRTRTRLSLADPGYEPEEEER
jgi:hypothetical protein